MVASEYLQARLRRALQTIVYLALVGGILVLSGWLVMGMTGVLWLLAFGVLLVFVPTRLPIPVLMRMRGARPLAPHEAPALHFVVRRLAERAGLVEVPALYLQRARELQAFAMVSAHESAIGVTSALLRELSLDELEGVVAHEMSHIQSGDTRVMSFAQAMRRLTHSLATLGFLLIPVSLLFGEAVPISPLSLALLIFAPTVSYLAELGLSRVREYDADLAAARLTRNPLGLARALHKLDYHQRSMLAAILGLGVDLGLPETLRTHPPTRERVARLLELVPKAPPRGDSPQISRFSRPSRSGLPPTHAGTMFAGR